jgi:hypothetical protein
MVSESRMRPDRQWRAARSVRVSPGLPVLFMRRDGGALGAAFERGYSDSDGSGTKHA